MSTPSGFYLPAQGAGGFQDGPEDLVAAQAFPPVSGAVVVHLHHGPQSGLLAVGGRLLTVAMFNDEVLPHFGLVPGQLLVLVACRMGARRQGAGLALAGALAIMAEHPVLAASGDVFTTPAGAVVVREAGVAAAGQPVLAGQPAGWLLFLADQADPVVFAATDLAAVLQNRALAGELAPAGPATAGWPASAAAEVTGSRDQMADGSLSRPARERVPA